MRRKIRGKYPSPLLVLPSRGDGEAGGGERLLVCRLGDWIARRAKPFAGLFGGLKVTLVSSNSASRRASALTRGLISRETRQSLHVPLVMRTMSSRFSWSQVDKRSRAPLKKALHDESRFRPNAGVILTLPLKLQISRSLLHLRIIRVAFR
jgi:hypothetical protein